MQPCSREFQSMASALNGTAAQIQSPNPNLQAHDDFFDQMLSALPSAWPDLDGSSHYAAASAADPYDESALLASRLRLHQISGGEGGGSPAAKTPAMFQLNQQQQMILNSNSTGGEGLFNGFAGSMQRAANQQQHFHHPHNFIFCPFQKNCLFFFLQEGEGVFNGFAGSMQRAANQQQHFHHPQVGSMQQKNFVAAQASGAAAGGGGGAVAQPRQRVRARRGQATDPHSIAERLRRERIAERMKALQELLPNANKTDKASMLDEIIDYVKFLQLQVKVLSMSRLGGAAAVAPLVSDISSESRGNNSKGATSAKDSLTVTEHQVIKLMEEDMGSAMQYLQGKGLCLMPISLASTISTVNYHPCVNPGFALNPNDGGDSPSSPNMSILTVQSAVGAGADGIKDATSVSKP